MPGEGGKVKGGPSAGRQKGDGRGISSPRPVAGRATKELRAKLARRKFKQKTGE